MADERFDRQIGFFGADGQARLERARVTIVGTGGTGSHVVQQLGYLGLRDFTLVEHDTVENTNLNRLVGGHPADAERASRKVDVAERLILAINPEAVVRKVPEGLFSEAGFAAVREADVTFGCVDKELPRLVLNELCQAYEVPYFDIATEIDPDNPRDFGGRVVFSAGGEGCIVCLGALDQEELRREQQSDAQRVEEQSIYGMRRRDLKGSGPSVVSLNGVLASAAVTEFVVYWTGLRAARRFLVYKGAFGVLSVVTDSPRASCPYCGSDSLVRGHRGGASVERWLTEVGARNSTP